MQKKLFPYFFMLCVLKLFSYDVQTVAQSQVNWENQLFNSELKLNLEEANLQMPSARNVSTNKMNFDLPFAIKDNILNVKVNSRKTLADFVLSDSIRFNKISEIIANSKKSPSHFLQDSPEIVFNHSISLKEISALLIKHDSTYKPQRQIDRVATREYTGIIIDARGILPIHGEQGSEKIELCFFPQIWNENMDLIFEKNMVDPDIAKSTGIIQYIKADYDSEKLSQRLGDDPLYINATEIYGIYRTDPVVSKKDALKILSNKHNIDLLQKGKVAILVDDDSLIEKISPKPKDERYQNTYKSIAKYFGDDEEIDSSDSPKGILISMHNVHFQPDSSEILESEFSRLEKIANAIKLALSMGNFEILVEGHTARIGNVDTELPLSEERVEKIVQELVRQGLNEKLFQKNHFGGERPIASNETPDGRALNRRVEIILKPKKTALQ